MKNCLIALALSLVTVGCSSVDMFKQELRVGVTPNFPPLVSEVDGKMEGFEVDLLEEVAENAGKKIIYVKYPLKELKKALESGKVDMIIGGITANEKREKRVNFTQTVIQAGQMHIVRKEDYARFAMPEMLMQAQGIKVGVERFTTGDDFATKEMKNALVIRYDSAENALEALRHKEIDVVVHDAPTSWSCKDKALTPTFVMLTNEQYAWAYRIGEHEKFETINREIGKLYTSEQYQTLWKKWIPNKTIIRYGD